MKANNQQIKTNSDGFIEFQSEALANINKAVQTGFLNRYQDDDVKRTHLFNGRYENIYLDESHIPELVILMNEAIRLANDILGTNNVSAGYWFNYMPPGAITTTHRHDDDDELLSAVYYITVPESSGDLIVHNEGEKVRITPEENMFIFFKPDVVHEVTENLSNQGRLSIGINFGIRTA